MLSPCRFISSMSLTSFPLNRSRRLLRSRVGAGLSLCQGWGILLRRYGDFTTGGDTRSIVAPLIPALVQIINEFVHFRWSTTGKLALGKLPSPEPTADRLPPQTHGATDGGLRLTGVEPGDDLLVPLQS